MEFTYIGTRCPKKVSGALGYLREYGCALIWEALYSSWIYLRRGFQVIQGCNPPDDVFLVALPFKLFGVKYIFDHHDVCPELYLSKYGRRDLFYKVQLWLEKVTFRLSDVVISTNNTYRELAITRGGMLETDVFVVRNGPDLRTFQLVVSKPALKFGKQFLVGYVGNMDSQEGLDILLDAVLELKNRGRRDVHFTCIGGGPGLQELRKMTQDKDLEDMVRFTGRIPDAELLDILSTADVCVNPDRPCMMNSMSTMIKIMEYMALGKPIVQFEGAEGRFSAQEASLYCDGDGNLRGQLCGKDPMAARPPGGKGAHGGIWPPASRDGIGMGILGPSSSRSLRKSVRQNAQANSRLRLTLRAHNEP